MSTHGVRRTPSYARAYSGRTALVTGAGSGIGAALTRERRRCGAIVAATDIDGDVDDLLDVTDPDHFRAVVAAHGVPDILFANVGISMGGRTEELSRADWDRIPREYLTPPAEADGRRALRSNRPSRRGAEPGRHRGAHCRPGALAPAAALAGRHGAAHHLDRSARRPPPTMTNRRVRSTEASPVHLAEHQMQLGCPQRLAT
jgi:hypothetical protein